MLTVDIALPVYRGNIGELEKSLKIQRHFYEELLNRYQWRILIAANGPLTEEEIEHIKQLCQDSQRVRYVHTLLSGKGAGILHAWQTSDAQIRVYLDVDLATDLKSVCELVASLEEGYDLCIGSRYHKDSKVTRLWKRKTISQIYHKFFLSVLLGARFTDGQCGFKAITAETARQLLPLVRDRGWFFESEMLLLAGKMGLRIKEIPVVWTETFHSSVNLLTVMPMFVLRVFQIFFRIRLPWKSITTLNTPNAKEFTGGF